CPRTATANSTATCSPTAATSANARTRRTSLAATATSWQPPDWPALEPARIHRQPGDRHDTGRQPWLDGRHQPGRHWPWPRVLVQPSPAVAALSRPPPEDIPMHRTLPCRRATSRTPLQAHAVPLALLAALMPALAVAQARTALPEEGRVVAGKASIDRQERTLTVTQQSGRAVLEWRSFDIGPDAAVRFIQPSSSSVALNRITGGNPSRIAGRLSANGHVYLVNSAGVLFAPGARVDVGHLVVSSLDVGNAEFMAGTDRLGTQGGTHSGPNAGLVGPNAAPLPPQLVVAAPPPGEDAAEPDPSAPAGEPGLLTLDAGVGGRLRIGLEPEQVQAPIEDGGLQPDSRDLAG